MEVTRVADGEEAASRAAEVLATALASARTVHGVAHGALAGGGTPRRAYELLGPMLDDWEGIHLWFGDERCVSPDDPEANSRMVAESLVAPGAVIHRIRGELGAEEAAAACAAEFDDTVLDVTLLGIGEDGHTASLFPGNPALHATGVAVAVNGSPKPPPDRVSLTLPTLNASRRIVLLVAGAAKAPPLHRVLEGPDPDVPASLLNRDVLEVIADAAALGES
jgi:6-phosphogluconolactonase